MAPTGKRVAYAVIALYRVVDGRIVEYHAHVRPRRLMDEKHTDGVE